MKMYPNFCNEANLKLYGFVYCPDASTCFLISMISSSNIVDTAHERFLKT